MRKRENLLRRGIRNSFSLFLRCYKRGGIYMDSLSESMTKHLCPTCCGECDKGLVIIKTKDTVELHLR